MTSSTVHAAPTRSRGALSPVGSSSAMWSGGGALLLVVIRGELTWRTSRRLHTAFRRAVDAGCRVLRVDLAQVTEADPAGIAVLLVYARLLPSLGGSLEIVDSSGACLAQMQDMQLSHLLNTSSARTG